MDGEKSWIYDLMEPMYFRQDLYIAPSAARGSYQCRVSTETIEEIRTLIFFDQSDVDYSPAVISLTQFEPDPEIKMSTVLKSLEPLKLQCTLSGLELDDIKRFEMSANRAREKGHMSARKGRYPLFNWQKDSEGASLK